MPRPNRPRKAYRPKPVHTNAHLHAIAGAHKLARADVAQQVHIMRIAVAEFSRGRDCAHHWRSLADTANVAESLAALGICSGSDAQRVIGAAQAALAQVAARHRGRGTWTLHATEIDALQWLVTLHARQLAECDYAELERAMEHTRRRVAQARAGNAPAGAIVVEGEIA